MKILKYLGLGLLGLVALVVGIGLVLPSKAHVERSVEVNASPAAVQTYLAEYKNFNQWSPWAGLDPNAKVEMSSPSSGVNAWYSWKGNDQVGAGKMTILKSEPGLIEQKLEFADMDNENRSSYLISSKDGGLTTLTWTMDADFGWSIMGRWFGLFFDSMIGKDYEKGLAKLKPILEALPKGMQITEQELPEQHYLSIRFKSKLADMGANLGKSYGQLMAQLKQQNLEEAGAPGAFYHTWNPTGLTDMEAFIPVKKPGKTQAGVTAGVRKAGKVLGIVYFGAYEGSGAAHEAIEKEFNKRGTQPGGSPWEEYITDPETEKDTTKWETRIYYPL